jgi:hypothetical protein
MLPQSRVAVPEYELAKLLDERSLASVGVNAKLRPEEALVELGVLERVSSIAVRNQRPHERQCSP